MSNDNRIAVSDAAAPTDNAHVAQDSSKPRQVNEQPELQTEASVNTADDSQNASDPESDQKEYGGQAGPDPTRYGDWEKKGRVTDF